MSTPKFFQQIGNNIEYAMKANNSGVYDSIQIADFFKSLVVRRDIFAEDTLYYTYTVQDGERPDQISKNEYGDEQYYWVVLQINGIVDFYNEWPMSYQELEEYVVKKYNGWDGAGEVHHYETVETTNSEGVTVLEGGLVVPEDFIYYYADNETTTLSSLPQAVSNLEYERRLNEAKGEIQLLDSRYIYDYVREYKLYLNNSKGQKSEVDISEIF